LTFLASFFLHEVFSAVVRVALNVGETLYCVDKLFRLIGLGNFYDHPHIGVAGRIGNNKERCSILPAVKWKLLNISRMDPAKHQKAIRKLRDCLDV
jgi:hypothetical protein